MSLLSTIRDTIKADNRSQMWIFENAQYITMSGSRAYDMYTEDSDYDVVGFTIPPKDIVFPYQHGQIYGFPKTTKDFDQYLKNHIPYLKSELDVQIFSIVKFLKLVAECNPNLTDVLFVKEEYVQKKTKIADMVRLNRQKLLHKGAYHRYAGYAISQMKKAKSLNRTGKRSAIVEKYGWDIKFGSHVVRLLDEAEQILKFRDIDLTRCAEQCKAIKRGEYSLKEVEQIFKEKEKYIYKLYQECKLPEKPDWEFVTNLLLRCLEQHYGSIDVCQKATRDTNLIRDIEDVMNKYR